MCNLDTASLLSANNLYLMVNGILILLLSMGAILLIAQWCLFVFQVKTDEGWDNLSKEEEAKVRQLIYDHLYLHPHSTIGNEYPHLADAAKATKAYEQLNKQYAEGVIDEIDYNLTLENLLTKINIEEDF